MSLKGQTILWFVRGVIETVRTGQVNLRTKVLLAFAKREVDKMESQELEGKSKWQSKAVWTAIIGAVLAAVQPVSTALGHPIVVPPWVYEVLGSIGLYALRDGIGKPLE